MAEIQLKNNEKKYIQFTIKDSDLELFDLSDMVATIQIQKYGDTTLSINSACEITGATSGEFRYLYPGTLPTGDYKAEIEFTTSGGLKYATPTFDIEIISSLPE